jgi:L-tryptophan--pyruvate aminotransferase
MAAMGSKDGGGGGGGMAAQAGRLGVVASVAFNLAALAFYLRRRYFGGDDAAAVRKKAEAEVAPSSGKPPVTKDSIINLDQ